MSFDNKLVSHIRHRRHDAAKSILERHRYLYKFVDDSGETLLHVSAKHGNAEMSQYLIQCGCKVDAQNNLGVTPLMLAVTEAQDDATVKVFLNANADVHLTDVRRSSALRKVVKISHTWLETLNAGSFYQLTKYCRILHMFFSKLEEKCAVDQELIAKSLRETHCPLALVMFMSNASVTKYLLDNGHPLNECLRNWSTLHIAVLLGDVDNVAVLLEYGADVNDQDNQQQTPLFLYDRDKDEHLAGLEILKILVNNGASLTIPRSDGLTLMEYFFTGSRKNTLMALVQSDTDELTKCTLNGQTPLHFWVKNRNEGTDRAIIELLLNKNIDVDASDAAGVTALVRAVDAGLVKKIKLLLHCGAKVNFIDIFEKTNLFDIMIDESGYEAKYTTIVDLLVNRGNSLLDYREPSASALPFQLHKDKNFTLAKSILCQLVLDEANTDSSISRSTFMKIEFKSELREHYCSCKLQLQDMKETKVYENITLYQLLSESEEKITLYARNKDFVEGFEEFMENKSREKFCYFYLLQKRVYKAVEQAILRSEACRIICKITQLYPDPNDNIFYKIVGYLSSQDLYNLLEV